MIQIIDVKENKNIEKFNAAAKKAHDHPETHGMLVKFYADWCGHCRNMTEDWAKLIHELRTNYRCKNPNCVLTIANIRVVNLDHNDPVVQNIKYVPKDIQGVPSIMYISKGTRGLEYSKDRVYSEMLDWIVSHPHFGLVKKGETHGTHDGVIRHITKKARTKFKMFHRDTLKRFHKEMKLQHKKSVKSRTPTPVAYHGKRYIPGYLRE